LARRIVHQTYGLLGTVSGRIGVDPLAEVTLGPLGIKEKFRFHLLRRDLGFLIQVFILRVYERHCRLEPGDVVIDCGAYIGDFTTRASKLVGDKGLVLAFEPNPQSYSLCAINIRKNKLSNVKLFNTALGSREQLGQLEVSRKNPGNTKVTTLAGKEDEAAIPVRPLQQFIPLTSSRSVKLMKMHVEGAASEILRGATDILSLGIIENFAVELHHGEEDLRALLEQHGYNCTVEGIHLYASSNHHTSASRHSPISRDPEISTEQLGKLNR
jgi:FkbM family methyltransferase